MLKLVVSLFWLQVDAECWLFGCLVVSAPVWSVWENVDLLSTCFVTPRTKDQSLLGRSFPCLLPVVEIWLKVVPGWCQSWLFRLMGWFDSSWSVWVIVHCMGCFLAMVHWWLPGQTVRCGHFLFWLPGWIVHCAPWSNCILYGMLPSDIMGYSLTMVHWWLPGRTVRCGHFLTRLKSKRMGEYFV